MTSSLPLGPHVSAGQCWKLGFRHANFEQLCPAVPIIDTRLGHVISLYCGITIHYHICSQDGKAVIILSHSWNKRFEMICPEFKVKQIGIKQRPDSKVCFYNLCSTDRIDKQNICFMCINRAMFLKKILTSTVWQKKPFAYFKIWFT